LIYKIRTDLFIATKAYPHKNGNHNSGIYEEKFGYYHYTKTKEENYPVVSMLLN